MTSVADLFTAIGRDVKGVLARLVALDGGGAVTGTRSASTVLYGDGWRALPSIDDVNAVKLTGDQIVAGIKTFSSGPVIPDGALAIGKTAGLQGALDAKAGTAHTHTAVQVSDSTATGRAVLTAADAATARTALGAGTSNLTLGSTGTTAAAGNHSHTAANITDSTATGRAVLTAADAAAARGVIGAATLSDLSPIGQQLVVAADAAAARSAIGAGTSDLAIGTTSTTAAAGDHTHASAAMTADGITDATTTGKSLIRAVDAAAGRAAIGAGTSNLAIGATASDAAAGNHTHTAAGIADSTTTGRALVTAVDATAARTTLAVPVNTTTITAGTGLTGGGNLTANRTLTVSYGTAAGTACQGNDARLSNNVQYVAQTLTAAQQTQARTNIAAAAVVQMTLAAYNALGAKDANTLYVIVG